MILWISAALWFVRVRSRHEFVSRSFIPLSMKRVGQSVRLNWNANAVEHASKAVLWISDGGKRRRLDLTKATLDKGTFLYSPESGEVTFEMEALRVVASGSLHFLAERSTDERPTNVEPKIPSAVTVPVSQATQPQRVLTPRQIVAPVRKTRRSHSRHEAALRSQPVLQEVHPTSRPVLLSPPAFHTDLRGEQLPLLPEGTMALPPPAAPVTTASYAAAPDSRWDKVVKRVKGVPLVRPSNYKEPEIPVDAIPRRKVEPEVPAFIISEITKECSVKLRVSIDKLGRVTDVEALPPLADHRLVGLAESAVRRWEFDSAQSRGRPVASRLIVTFTFRNPRAGKAE